MPDYTKAPVGRLSPIWAVILKSTPVRSAQLPQVSPSFVIRYSLIVVTNEIDHTLYVRALSPINNPLTNNQKPVTNQVKKLDITGNNSY
jgi:hypothetical protein